MRFQSMPSSMMARTGSPGNTASRLFLPMSHPGRLIRSERPICRIWSMDSPRHISASRRMPTAGWWIVAAVAAMLRAPMDVPHSTLKRASSRSSAGPSTKR
jgi:hypothetical protein